MNLSDLGHFSLALAVFVTAYAVLADVAGARLRRAGLVGSARNALGAQFLCLTVALASLAVALLGCDMRLVYVSEHVSRTLPWGYRFSALWAGASGSLLLWLWLQSGAAAMLFRPRGRAGLVPPVARVAVNVVALFFLLALLADKNPFALNEAVPGDGTGLNPLLQHPAMILHPPILFVGYALFIVPFAWVVGQLAAGPQDAAPRWCRRSIVVAWLFLTAGIVLGSWWAYEELGWGGFWAWDPVENSSLMPWLAGTALLHSFKRYRRGGGMFRWCVVLAVLTYSLCVFGTFLTRYGLVSSVHAFPDPGWGLVFLVLVAVIWLAVGVLFWRRRGVAGASEAGEGVREASVAWTNWIMLAMIAVILVGTLFPFFSGLVSERKISLQPEYFTKITSPVAFALVLLMGVCPAVFGGRPRLIWPISVAVAGAIGAFVLYGMTKAMAPAALAVCGASGVNLAMAAVVRAAAQGRAETLWSRRSLGWFAALLAHAGVVLSLGAIAAAEGYGLDETFSLRQGQTREVGRFTVAYEQPELERRRNHVLSVARVVVSSGKQWSDHLRPGLAKYDSGQVTSEVDIHRSLAGDVYVALTATEDGGELINLRLQVKPGINWLWIGSGFMMVGGVVALPVRARRRQ